MTLRPRCNLRCGTRAGYQAGGRCVTCRAANACYEATYRHRQRTGQLPLGSLVPAARTHTLMKALRAEMTKTQLELAMGWDRHYARVQQAPKITLRTAVKVQRIWRRSRFGLDSTPLPFEQQAIALETLNDLGKH